MPLYRVSVWTIIEADSPEEARKDFVSYLDENSIDVVEEPE